MGHIVKFQCLSKLVLNYSIFIIKWLSGESHFDIPILGTKNLYFILYFGRTLFCKICAFKHQVLANFKYPFSHYTCRLKEKIAPKIEFLHFGQIDFCSFEFTILIQNSFISIICQKILLLLIFYIHKFCNNPTCFCQVYVSGCTSKLTYMMNAFIPCISITFNFNNGITWVETYTYQWYWF